MLLCSTFFFYHCDFMCIGLWKDKPDQQQLKWDKGVWPSKHQQYHKQKTNNFCKLTSFTQLGLKEMSGTLNFSNYLTSRI